jgi:hypothetical protein
VKLVPAIASVLALALAASGAAAQEPPEGPAPPPEPLPAEPTPPAPSPPLPDTAKLEARLRQQEDRAAAQEARIVKLEGDVEAANATATAAVDQAATQAAAAESTAQRFRIYGFTDAGFKKAWIHKPSQWNNIIDDESTFVIGNVNLYFDARPVDGFRALTEVRFTNYPNGVEFGSSFERQNTTIYDTNSPTGRNRIAWGSIVLERAWVQWDHFDFLKVRAGYFLTPFGIWNVDHGTPTLIALAMPDFWAMEYFPIHQTGVEILGSVPVGAWELGYHATVSNGRSPTQQDATDLKAFGGRVFARLQDVTSLTFGISGYADHYRETEKTLVDVNPLRVTARETIAYDEYALGADFSLDSGPLRVRVESAMHRLAYDEGHRAEYGITGSGAFKPDFYNYDLYGLVAYALPWAGLEPYVYSEHRWDESDSMQACSLGLNIRFNEAAQLKLQHGVSLFPDRPTKDDDFSFFDSRFVLAF